MIERVIVGKFLSFEIACAFRDPQKALAERLAKVKRDENISIPPPLLGERGNSGDRQGEISKTAAEIAQSFLEATANAPVKTLTHPPPLMGESRRDRGGPPPKGRRMSPPPPEHRRGNGPQMPGSSGINIFVIRYLVIQGITAFRQKQLKILYCVYLTIQFQYNCWQISTIVLCKFLSCFELRSNGLSTQII